MVEMSIFDGGASVASFGSRMLSLMDDAAGVSAWRSSSPSSTMMITVAIATMQASATVPLITAVAAVVK
jgi:acyl-CoA hydrolase